MVTTSRPALRGLATGPVRRALCLLAALAGLLSVGCESPVTPPTTSPAAFRIPVSVTPPPERPHIVLILADDLGWADVGYQGGWIPTPNLNRLAAAGVRMDRFYTLPVCTPARAALLTGRHPVRLGMADGIIRANEAHSLPLDERTLAELLRAEGYATAMIGKWHLGAHRPECLPTRRGFDYHFGCYSSGVDYYTKEKFGVRDWYRNEEPVADDAEYATDSLTDDAVRLIAAHDPATPLFLYLPYTAPHRPWQAPDEYVRGRSGSGHDQRYAGMVICLDQSVARIEAALRKAGLWDRTLLVFCSDNGAEEPVSNQPLRGVKKTLYEGGVRVPAFAVWENVLPAGGVVETAIHITDLFPTLLERAGAARPPLAIDGQDVWDLLRGQRSDPGREVLLNLSTRTAAILEGRHKLVVSYEEAIPFNVIAPRKHRSVELFDVFSDPRENTNLAGQSPDLVQHLLARLEEYRRTAPAEIQRGRPTERARDRKGAG